MATSVGRIVVKLDDGLDVREEAVNERGRQSFDSFRMIVATGQRSFPSLSGFISFSFSIPANSLVTRALLSKFFFSWIVRFHFLSIGFRALVQEPWYWILWWKSGKALRGWNSWKLSKDVRALEERRTRGTKTLEKIKNSRIWRKWSIRLRSTLLWQEHLRQRGYQGP